MSCKALWDEPEKCKDRCCFECDKMYKCQKKDLTCKTGISDEFKKCEKYYNKSEEGK